MEASLRSTPTGEHGATILVAIELSMKSWLVVIHSPARDRLSRHKVAAGDVSDLLAHMDRARSRAARSLGCRVAVVSCYEAGYDGFWLHRRLGAAGIESLVIDPASVMVDRRARRAKSDRIDGEQMIRALMSHLRGEPRALSVVRVPSVAQEDARRPTRERERLIKERTGHLNRIKGLLRTLGLAAGRVGRADWPDWLAGQRDWQGRPVPSRLHEELLREHARLRLLCEQITALEGQAAPEENRETATQLQHLKGIGPVIAGTLAGELYWKDFRNRRELGAYLGLAPSPWRSGGIEHDQGISKAGNRRARQVAIELAWLWLRHQPDSALSRWFHDRVGDQRGRIRRTAIVALARKLIIALWRFITTGLVPTDAVLSS